MDKDRRYLATAIFSVLYNLLENNEVNFLKVEELEDSLELTKCNVEEVPLLLKFQEVLSSIIDLLGVRRPNPSQRQVLS